MSDPPPCLTTHLLLAGDDEDEPAFESLNAMQLSGLSEHVLYDVPMSVSIPSGQVSTRAHVAMCPRGQVPSGYASTWLAHPRALDACVHWSGRLRAGRVVRAGGRVGSRL